MAPNIRLRGLRSPAIPPGYILGRTAKGQGEVELLDLRQLGAFGLATIPQVEQIVTEATSGSSGTTKQVATTNLGGNRVVGAVPGGVAYPDRTVAADGPLVLGITETSALAGQDVRVRYEGSMVEVSWAWTLGPVFVGDAGNLTQAPSASGWIRQVGVALSATELWIDLQPAMITP